MADVAAAGTAVATTTAVGTRAGTAQTTAAGGRPGRVPDGLKPGGELDRLAADMAAKDQFSGSLLVTHQGRTVLSRSHGFANRQTSVRNGPNTRFPHASVTKMFTALAIHQLAQQGKVGYGGKLGTYLDGFPAETADKVTVHHLLTHSSGLGHYYKIPGYKEESLTWNSAEKVFNSTVKYIRRSGSGLAFEPGALRRQADQGRRPGHQSPASVPR